MNWLSIVTIAYFLIALEVILDKFLLSSKRINHPAVYTFYSGVLSFFTIILFPFGAREISFLQFLYYIFPGIIFAYGIFSLFFAIQKSEASRVTPVVGAVVPVITYFLSIFILGEHLSFIHLWGVAILILGGLFISWDFSKGAQSVFFPGFYQAILSGVLIALAFTILKNFYNSDNFLNVFVWSRMGVTAGALSLALIPRWRKIIWLSLKRFRKPEKENRRSGFLFIFNKILGGFGSILLNFSVSLGNVTIINALVALEYTFIFILGAFFSIWLPRVFQEKTDWKNTAQKLSAIALIATGIILVSM